MTFGCSRRLDSHSNVIFLVVYIVYFVGLTTPPPENEDNLTIKHKVLA